MGDVLGARGCAMPRLREAALPPFGLSLLHVSKLRSAATIA